MNGFAPRIYTHTHARTGHVYTQTKHCVCSDTYVCCWFFLHYNKVIFIVKLSNAINQPSPTSSPPNALDYKWTGMWWVWMMWPVAQNIWRPPDWGSRNFFHYKIVGLAISQDFPSIFPCNFYQQLASMACAERKKKRIKRKESLPD